PLGRGRRPARRCRRRFRPKLGWLELEVGAPDVPRWQRTVDFYLGYGFKEVGPGSGCTYRRYFRRAQRETITMTRKE
ncbi:MAG: hypothetical protein VCB77_08015, partial [Alphaproteobacteria bacterium]